jgi:hypothetical protein
VALVRYLVPTSMEIPSVKIEHLHGPELDEVPSKDVVPRRRNERSAV